MAGSEESKITQLMTNLQKKTVRGKAKREKRGKGRRGNGDKKTVVKCSDVGFSFVVRS